MEEKDSRRKKKSNALIKILIEHLLGAVNQHHRHFFYCLFTYETLCCCLCSIFFSLDFILGFFTCVIFRFISVSVTPNCTSLFLAYYKFQHIIVISFVSLESLHKKITNNNEKKRQQFKWYIFEFPQNPAEFWIIWKLLQSAVSMFPIHSHISLLFSSFLFLSLSIFFIEFLSLSFSIAIATFRVYKADEQSNGFPEFNFVLVVVTHHKKTSCQNATHYGS